MSSRHSAARPSRAGETFARTHHHEGDEYSDTSASKRVKFDVRNPSALAPDAAEEDIFLEADVIGKSGAAKRGAVNIDGYDSDSENETFNARAQERRKGPVDLNETFETYSTKKEGRGSKPPQDDDDDDDMNMFADADDTSAAKSKSEEDPDFHLSGKKKKEVHFLGKGEIKGEDLESRDREKIRLDDGPSDDDDEDRELAIEEEGVDEEVGAGGLKKYAPKVEAFNLKAEHEEGRFDTDGNFVRKAADPDAVHDRWLDGLSKTQIKKAAAAHEKREADAARQRREEDSIVTSELLSSLILNLEKGETPFEALARLGKSQIKQKKVPKWKTKKLNKGSEPMDTDDPAASANATEDPEQVRIKEAIRAITDAADKLFSREHTDIYDQERELLMREYQKESGLPWTDPVPANVGDADEAPAPSRMWEFRWTDSRDGDALQGPYDGPTMEAWRGAGYFAEGVEFRPVGVDSKWTRIADFT